MKRIDDKCGLDPLTIAALRWEFEILPEIIKGGLIRRDALGNRIQDKNEPIYKWPAKYETTSLV